MKYYRVHVLIVRYYTTVHQYNNNTYDNTWYYHKYYLYIVVDHSLCHPTTRGKQRSNEVILVLVLMEFCFNVLGSTIISTLRHTHILLLFLRQRLLLCCRLLRPWTALRRPLWSTQKLCLLATCAPSVATRNTPWSGGKPRYSGARITT